jgi:hypothetical protein
VFLGGDFTLTRPYRSAAKPPIDYVQAVREEGPTIVQAFHERYGRRGGYLAAVLADVCAFANTNGGVLYLGLSSDPQQPPAGIGNPRQVIEAIQAETARRITPPLEISADVQETQGKKVVRVVVPQATDLPCAVDDNKIYIRTESETELAVRDEIANLVRRTLLPQPRGGEQEGGRVDPPRTGVEIVATEERHGVCYHTMRDLRNGNVVKNVTRKSARRLWHYAITQVEDRPVDAAQLHWEGDVAFVRKRETAGIRRYDLAQRDDGGVRFYYGVTDDGIHGPWSKLVEPEAEAAET